MGISLCLEKIGVPATRNKIKMNKPDLKQKISEYIKYAKENGALNAVQFSTKQIVFDERTILKCAFGCKDWGKNHTCPSADSFLGLDMYKRVLQKYKTGIIIHCDNKKISQEISFALESKAYVDGFYWAFSLSDCALCGGNCSAALSGSANPHHPNISPCRHKKKARPAFHSVGIDVFATVHKFGLPLLTLKENDKSENWYSAVFID